MKATETFKKTISDHLEHVAKNDPLFAETLKKENKNIDDCINYIFNQVQASGCTGFADEEIFNMAIHYYDEDDVKPGEKVNAQVVVNHSLELSQEDIEKAKKQALKNVVSEEEQKIRQKPKKVKALPKTIDSPSLFDAL